VSQVCNTIASLDQNTMEEKSALARSVSIAMLGALSDCYKAIENLQTPHAAKSEVVYLQSAVAKLETGEKALCKIRDILASVRPSDEAITWLKELDFDRLYQDGLQRGLIPSSTEQWNRLVQINQTQNYLGVAKTLIADFNSVKTQIESLIKTLGSVDTASLLKREDAHSMLCMQTALAEFTAFGQMVAYVNAIEPLKDEWRKAKVDATAV
jgi:hypothetical protein